MAIHYADIIANMLVVPAVPGDFVIVGGYHAVGDGGGGKFICMASAPPLSGWVPDGGLFFTGPTLSFQRIVNSPYISVKWFGAYGDNFHGDDAAINAAFHAIRNYADGGGVQQMISGNSVLSDSQDGTKTRIYFPAGVYLLNKPIAEDLGGGMYGPYEAYNMEFIGERAILEPKDPLTFPAGVHLVSLKPINSTIVRGITFRKWDTGLYLVSDQVANVLLEDLDFFNMVDHALIIDCPKAVVAIENSCFETIMGMYVFNGEVNIRGCRMVASDWTTYFIGVGTEAIVNMKNSTCLFNSTNYFPSPYAPNAAWILNDGCFRAVNVKFFGPAINSVASQMGHIVISTAVGRRWSSMGTSEKRIVIKDCFCSCTNTIKLTEIPNVIILENNTGFINREFVLDYAGTLPLADLLYSEYYGLFSIKMNDVPFYGTALYQSNLIYSKRNPNNTFPIPNKEQLSLLPFFRINSGLDSYGYAEDFTYPATPTIMRFFMGKQSFDGMDANNSAIYGDCSFEVKLVGVTTYDPTSGNYYEGNVCLYNNYRVNCKVVGGITEIDSIDSIGGEDTYQWAPKLINDGNILKVTSQGHLPGPPPTHTIYERYGIYYQIRNLIPPVAEPFPG